MTSEAEKKPEISDPSDEIIRNVKRSGVFDKIKRNVLEDLQELNEIKVSKDYMLNLVRINFDKHNKDRAYPPKINERRMMLKNMISNATMFDSLANSIQNSQVFKDAADKLSEEVDKLIPQYYPDLVYNPRTKEWGLPQPDSSIPLTSSCNDYQYAHQINGESPQDMEMDSSSTESSAEDLKDLELPPPPPFPPII